MRRRLCDLRKQHSLAVMVRSAACNPEAKESTLQGKFTNQGECTMPVPMVSVNCQRWADE